MPKVLSIDLDNYILITEDGNEHILFPHEYWILCPSITSWYPTDGKINPLNFGILLHNARNSCGLVLAQEDLLKAIAPQSLKTGNILKAEKQLEKIRKKYYPSLPSRLRCHYLNYDKETAEERIRLWGWHNRSLERCYLVLSGGFYHYADVSIFEQLCNDSSNVILAHSYWKPFNPTSQEEFARLEILANSCLYFPDWENYSEVSWESLALWNKYNTK